MVVGESQILGQVGDAFDVAAAAGTVGRVLGRVLPLALEVGKRARAQTRIGQGLLSVSSVAVQSARAALGDLRDCMVLVIGAGEAGEATVRSLLEAGVAGIVVANRSVERANQLAASVGGYVIPSTDILHALETVDIVISATGAGDYVVRAEDMRRIMQHREGRRLICIDIAVPRDLDPRLADVPGVVLHNVDDLEAISAGNLEGRRREVVQAEAIVERGIDDFIAWRSVEKMVPTIGALYQRADAIRRLELDRTLRRLGGLSADEQSAIEAMTSAIVRRILHDPVMTLRARGGDPEGPALVRSVQELFHLPAEKNGLEKNGRPGSLH
jgi:glutamyl-tRNA reductase